MPATDYPRLELDNGRLRVSVYVPDAEHGYYRGPRFDWSGMIEHVETARHRFYSPLHVTHDPMRHDCVSGPAEEFAMFEPMGFAEARRGETFVKIGVGLLEKGNDDEYQFAGDYRIVRAGEWDIRHAPDSVEFSQELAGDRGWGYTYTKTIALVPGKSELIIAHRLENSGEKKISINNYNHNFSLIDNLPYGPDYRVEFPFTTMIPIRINQFAWFRGNTVEVPEPLGDRSLWIPLFEGAGRVEYNRALIKHEPSGASIEFIGDAPVTRMVFWAVERAACPEPFIRLKIAPGETEAWSSRYHFGDGR
ncbi:MAG: hypothetical protein QNJ19_04935 [Woeseiaceae bacterium]|nr:hypothetical protein [Woeseiaceae bacterium]